MESRLGEVIKEYLDRHPEVSLRKLAEISGISRGYLSMLKNERNPTSDQPMDPSIGILKKLSDGMGITLERLLYLAGYTEEEGIELRADDLPPEHRRILTEHGIDYLLVTKEAHENGITPTMLRDMIELVKRMQK